MPHNECLGVVHPARAVKWSEDPLHMRHKRKADCQRTRDQHYRIHHPAPSTRQNPKPYRLLLYKSRGASNAANVRNIAPHMPAPSTAPIEAGSDVEISTVR